MTEALDSVYRSEMRLVEEEPRRLHYLNRRRQKRTLDLLGNIQKIKKKIKYHCKVPYYQLFVRY